MSMLTSRWVLSIAICRRSAIQCFIRYVTVEVQCLMALSSHTLQPFLHTLSKVGYPMLHRTCMVSYDLFNMLKSYLSSMSDSISNAPLVHSLHTMHTYMSDALIRHSVVLSRVISNVASVMSNALGGIHSHSSLCMSSFELLLSFVLESCMCLMGL